MDIIKYCEQIKDSLYPKPYTDCISQLPSDLNLFLWHKKLYSARYALAVTSWNSTSEISFLEKKRGVVRRTLGAMWMLREVGLYLDICGKKEQWEPYTEKMKADKTGLHAVIIQAVHFIDIEAKKEHLNQSAWGPVRFGGVDSVASVISSISLES